MHRLLTNAPLHMHVDHINMDPLDNRKENLRICTRSQNCMNKKNKGGKSDFKGVSGCNRDSVWYVYVVANHVKHHMGSFKDETEAAIAYNEAALKYHGEFARINEIDQKVIDRIKANPLKTKRRRFNIVIDGQKVTMERCCKILGVSRQCVYDRFDKMPIHEAVSMPRNNTGIQTKYYPAAC